MSNENEYTDLIAGAHRGKERFAEWIFQLTAPLKTARERLAGMVGDFDVDRAEGAQLDAVGVRVGLNRKLKTTISDVFFAFDDVGGAGFDKGIWKEPRDSTYGITELGDGVFRTLVKAKVALNQYGGCNEDVERTLDLIRESFGLERQSLMYVDEQNMSITLYVCRRVVPPVIWKIFESGIFAFNHAGVEQCVVDGVTGNLATTKSELMTSDDGDYYLMDLK